MSCPDCGKRVPVLFNALEEVDDHCTVCLRKYRKKFIAEQIRKRGEDEQNND